MLLLCIICVFLVKAGKGACILYLMSMILVFYSVLATFAGFVIGLLLLLAASFIKTLSDASNSKEYEDSIKKAARFLSLAGYFFIIIAFYLISMTCKVCLACDLFKKYKKENEGQVSSI